MRGSIVTAIRNGHILSLPEDDLQQGDILLFQPGDFIPVDVIVMEGGGIRVDEFDVTGEIFPVWKEKNSIISQGSRVVNGSGKGIVRSIGKDNGDSPFPIPESQPKASPSRIAVDRNFFALWLFLSLPFLVWYIEVRNLALVLGVFIVFSLLIFVLQNDLFQEKLQVAFIKKGFDKRGTIIKDVSSFQKIADLDIVCFDKTGVLTTRNVTVSNLYPFERITETLGGQHENPDSVAHMTKLGLALCNDISTKERVTTSDPIDIALVAHARKLGVHIESLAAEYTRIYELPFISEKRYMQSGYRNLEGEEFYFTKGDPEFILDNCSCYLDVTGEIKDLNSRQRYKIKAFSRRINATGDSTLALASSPSKDALNSGKMVFLCLLQLENTLQEHARELIDALKAKGIKSYLLSGDRCQTALKIAALTGIVNNSKACLNGHIIKRMSMQEVIRQAEYCSIFSALNPSQKGNIISQFREQGHQVMMVGDGYNDKFALKVADVGISFLRDSSYIARKESNILVNSLDEIAWLFDFSNFHKKQTRILKIVRKTILFLIFLLLYLSVFWGWNIL